MTVAEIKTGAYTKECVTVANKTNKRFSLFVTRAFLAADW
jgi:hypothetical protein